MRTITRLWCSACTWEDTTASMADAERVARRHERTGPEHVVQQSTRPDRYQTPAEGETR